MNSHNIKFLFFNAGPILKYLSVKIIKGFKNKIILSILIYKYYVLNYHLRLFVHKHTHIHKLSLLFYLFSKDKVVKVFSPEYKCAVFLEDSENLAFFGVLVVYHFEAGMH